MRKIKVTPEQMKIIKDQRDHWIEAYPGSGIAFCCDLLFKNVAVDKEQKNKKLKKRIRSK